MCVRIITAGPMRARRWGPTRAGPRQDEGRTRTGPGQDEERSPYRGHVADGLVVGVAAQDVRGATKLCEGAMIRGDTGKG